MLPNLPGFGDSQAKYGHGSANEILVGADKTQAAQANSHANSAETNSGKQVGRDYTSKSADVINELSHYKLIIIILGIILAGVLLGRLIPTKRENKILDSILERVNNGQL